MSFDGHRGPWPPWSANPNSQICPPRPFLTSEMAAVRAAEHSRHWHAQPLLERTAADDLAEEIAAKRKAAWNAAHPGAGEQDWICDPAEYATLGKLLYEAGCVKTLAAQLLTLCVLDYRRSIKDPSLPLSSLDILDTHRTIVVRDGIRDPYLICTRCNATYRQLTDAACRGAEIERERRQADKEKLSDLLSVYSQLGA